MSELLDVHKDHRRSYDDLIYVYAVISRRSQGLSIGINLNPDKICNFDCIYCEVDRKTAPRARKVDVPALKDELSLLLNAWKSGAIWETKRFRDTPVEWRRLNDIAFSGDGEPTTCPVFDEAVDVTYQLRDFLCPPETKLVLITDAGCLTRPVVKRGLERMRGGAHEIWAKLDAGTEDYYKTVNRSAIPLQRILDNILQTSLWLPLTIQSLFLRVHDLPPSDDEIHRYCDRLEKIIQDGGQLQKLQLYTVARPTPEAFATSLTRDELDHLASIVKSRIDLPQELAYGNAES